MAPKKRKSTPNRRVAAPYRPGSSSTIGYRYGQNILDGKPLFIPEVDIPRMIDDPLIQFGIRLLISPLRKAKIIVKCDDQDAALFIDATVKKFWQEAMPSIADDYFTWGYAAYLPAYQRNDEDGTYKFDGGRSVWNKEAIPHIYKEGANACEFAGLELVGQSDIASELVKPPFSFWFGGQEKRSGVLYDHSRLRFAFDPYMEKETRGGIKDRRRLFHVKMGIPTTVVYHPPGRSDPADPNSDLNKDIAYEISEKIASGNVITMPDTRTPDDKGEPRWRVQVLETAKPGFDFEQVMDYEDKLILLGLGIPREIFEAADTGSGYSGRAIPMDTFLGMSDQIVGLLVKAMDAFIIRHLVDHNYGPELKYELQVEPLAKSVSQQDQPQPGQEGANPLAAMMGGGGNVEQASPAATGGGDDGASVGRAPAAPEKGGGGDPTAGGLVPYVGRFGGRGKKNPRTGRIYYNMSYEGKNYGCLLAPVHGSLRDEMLRFANSIPHEELYDDDGVEESPHLTLRYGLMTEDGDAVMNSVSSLGSLRFNPSSIKVFEQDDCDVLYVSCQDESCARKWFDKTACHKHSNPTHEYTPHLTLAYLKKGEGAKYIGQTLDGECEFPSVEYYAPSGGLTKAMIWPSAEELMEALSGEVVNLGWFPQDYTKRDGTPGVKAVGYGEHQDLTLYGPDAERALDKELETDDPAFELSPSQREALKSGGSPNDEAKIGDYKSPSLIKSQSVIDAQSSIKKKKTPGTVQRLTPPKPEPKKTSASGIASDGTVPALTDQLERDTKAKSSQKAPSTSGDLTAKLADGRQLSFVPRSNKPNAKVVMVDPDKLDASWANDESYYIPKGGGGAEIEGRRAGFERFMQTGRPIEMPYVSVGADGQMSFEDGRHRFSVLRDMGVNKIPVMVDADSADEFSSRFGVNADKATDVAPPKPVAPASAKPTPKPAPKPPVAQPIKKVPVAQPVSPQPKPPVAQRLPSKPKDGTPQNPIVAKPVADQPIPFKDVPAAEPIAKPTALPQKYRLQPDSTSVPVAKRTPTALHDRYDLQGKPGTRSNPVVAKPVVAPAELKKTEDWATDKMASMSDQISQMLYGTSGNKPTKTLSQELLRRFQVKARDAVRQAMEQGRDEVRLPVKIGDKDVYVVVKRKKKTNMSHGSTADMWEIDIVERVNGVELSWIRVDNSPGSKYPFHAMNTETGDTRHGREAAKVLETKPTQDSPQQPVAPKGTSSVAPLTPTRSTTEPKSPSVKQSEAYSAAGIQPPRNDQFKSSDPSFLRGEIAKQRDKFPKGSPEHNIFDAVYANTESTEGDKEDGAFQLVQSLVSTLNQASRLYPSQNYDDLLRDFAAKIPNVSVIGEKGKRYPNDPRFHTSGGQGDASPRLDKQNMPLPGDESEVIEPGLVYTRDGRRSVLLRAGTKIVGSTNKAVQQSLDDDLLAESMNADVLNDDYDFEKDLFR